MFYRNDKTQHRHSTRRDFLRAGAVTALGLSLSNLVSAQAAAATKTSKAKSCILIWLDGGPSHLDLFDLKPTASAEVRGPFAPIDTAVAGIQICEWLPRTAQIFKQVAIVRSVTSPLGEHNLGTHYMLSGYKPSPVLNHPAFGSVVAHLKEATALLPQFIAVPDHRVGGNKASAQGYLPASTGPFEVGAVDGGRFRVPNLDYFTGLNAVRLNNRRGFSAAFDRFAAKQQGLSEQTGDPVFEQAYRLITSEKAKLAFDLSDEPNSIRQRYGSKPIGQHCLLARRLVERGVPFVTVNNIGWDTHQQLTRTLKEGFAGAKDPVGLIPSFDLAFSGLVSDLNERGLLDETLVVTMGEFGRTPKINTQAGRDHWPRVFSVAFAGGGIAGGQVIGSSDATGESPKDRPVTPADVARTIYTLLGIDPDQYLRTADGRPVPISQESQTIGELLR